MVLTELRVRPGPKLSSRDNTYLPTKQVYKGGINQVLQNDEEKLSRIFKFKIDRGGNRITAFLEDSFSFFSTPNKKSGTF